MFDRFLSIPCALNLPGLEYKRVVNMPRLHIVLRKLCFKDSQYFECLEFWICYGFEYIRSLNMLYFRVLNKILHRIYLTGFWIYHGFKICQGSEYIRVLNMSGFIKKTPHHIDAWQGSDYSIPQVLQIPGFQICEGYTRFLKKCCIIDAWQDSKYSSGSKHGTVLNVPGLRKVLKKTLHYRYLIGFWICL